jgi:cyclopropane-fatty-acyl-phospholipid synthase
MWSTNTVLSSAACRYLDGSMSEFQSGALELTLPGGARVLRQGPDPGHHAAMEIRRWRSFSQVARRGDIGLAESYVRGDWETPNLSDLMSVLASNVDGFESRFSVRGMDRLWTTIQHRMRGNTKRQSRRNIAAHYDLGNDFYELWLDPTMTYSSALFTDLMDTLEYAQRAKFRRILDETRLAPNSHVLEIGCGWGGFAEMAVEAGHRVTCVTISPAQYAYAARRLAPWIREGVVDLRLEDYRDVRGTFDGVVSIEMFEAVGEQWWPTYMATLRRLLAPGARAVVQTITIDPKLFEGYRSHPDFIQTYIFPGGMLSSPHRFQDVASQAGLVVRDKLFFGDCYARTLRDWQDSFNQADASVRALGFDTEFIRLWNFYFSYCVGGFEAGRTNVAHFTLEAA